MGSISQKGLKYFIEPPLVQFIVTNAVPVHTMSKLSHQRSIPRPSGFNKIIEFSETERMPIIILLHSALDPVSVPISLCCLSAFGVLNFHTGVLRVVGAGVSEDPGSLFLMTIGRKEVCFSDWGYQKECRATCNVEESACGISDCREKRRQSVVQVYNGLVIFRRGNWTGWLMNAPVETLLRCRSSSMYFGGVNSCVGNILAKFWFPRWSASSEAYVLVLKDSHQASLVNRTSNLITSLEKLERHRRSVSP